MNEEINKPIHISELDFRIQSINGGKYATILVYKDARVDMNRLNSVYGAGKWQRKHEVIGGNMFCSVGVWHEESKSWAWVQDCGTESMTEKEKGQASDSFKRACFNLGIGIELYDYPLIQIPLFDSEVKKVGDKYKQSFNLKLRDWKWALQREDSKITFLAAIDNNNKSRFVFGENDESKPLETKV